MHKEFIKLAEKELERKINFSKSFDDNGLDSLDLMTFISLFEDFYKIKISEKNYKKIKNFSSFEKLIK